MVTAAPTQPVDVFALDALKALILPNHPKVPARNRCPEILQKALINRNFRDRDAGPRTNSYANLQILRKSNVAGLAPAMQWVQACRRSSFRGALRRTS